MIDLDELERKLAYCERAHREADGMDTQAAQKVWATAEINLLDALRNAAPELIAMARRWQTVRRYFLIDDVGDEFAVYALCVDSERLEEHASLALCSGRSSDISVEQVIDAMQEQKP